MNILFRIVPLLYILALFGAAIYAFGRLVRFVRASERTTAALEEIARKNR